MSFETVMTITLSCVFVLGLVAIVVILSNVLQRFSTNETISFKKESDNLINTLTVKDLIEGCSTRENLQSNNIESIDVMTVNEFLNKYKK